MFTGAKSCELPSPHPFMRPEGSAKAPGYAHLVQEGAGGQACASAPEPIAADSYGTKKTPTPVVGEHGAEDSWEAPPPPPSPPSPPPPPLPFTGLPPPTPVPKRVIGKFKHLGCLLFSRDACHSLFLVAFILAGSLIFLTSVVKHDEVYSIVIVSVLTALSLSFLFCAVSIDPGIVPPLPYDQAATGDVRVIIKGTEVVCKVCTTCHIVRPPRSSHCRFCDVCVEEFDHHCGVLGCCVGRRTYRFFAGFFIVTLFLSLYALIRSIVVLAMFDYKRDNHDAASRWRIAASALCLAAGVFGAAFTAPFTGKYLMMSCLNTTEKELLRTNDTCSPNEPYHEGYCVNVVKRFFSRIPPSKVRGREEESV